MPKTLFVGNLPFNMTEESLRALFETAGDVSSVRIIKDRETQRTRGFAFVEFAADHEADQAITEFSGRTLGGRQLVVNEARPREAMFSSGGGHRR